MTKARPILFSAPMVRAILAGRKTQTRRAVNLPSVPIGLDPWTLNDPQSPPDFIANNPRANGFSATHIAECRHGRPGDRLWVREKWAPFSVTPNTPVPCSVDDADGVRFFADRSFYVCESGGAFTRIPIAIDAEWFDARHKWRPSIHMPRWASRITLEITDVRVERLQSISEEDAAAEGVDPTVILPGDVVSHVAGFGALWDAINHARAPWDSNPWVWVISFNGRQQ